MRRARAVLRAASCASWAASCGTSGRLGGNSRRVERGAAYKLPEPAYGLARGSEFSRAPTKSITSPATPQPQHLKFCHLGLTLKAGRALGVERT